MPTTTMKPPYSQPDRGYAWLILLASFVGHVLQYGVVWTVGVFYVVFMEKLDQTDSGQVALISSLNMAACYGTGSYMYHFFPPPFCKYGHYVKHVSFFKKTTHFGITFPF